MFDTDSSAFIKIKHTAAVAYDNVNETWLSVSVVFHSMSC